MNANESLKSAEDTEDYNRNEVDGHAGSELEAGTSFTLKQNVETPTFSSARDFGTQTQNDDLELVRSKVCVDENGEIRAKEHETIVELKFGHDMSSWEEILRHIKEKLRMKIVGKAWLANTGPHFRIVAFIMEKKDLEDWKFRTLNWENIIRTVRVSRLIRKYDSFNQAHPPNNVI